MGKVAQTSLRRPRTENKVCPFSDLDTDSTARDPPPPYSPPQSERQGLRSPSKADSLVKEAHKKANSPYAKLVSQHTNQPAMAIRVSALLDLKPVWVHVSRHLLQNADVGSGAMQAIVPFEAGNSNANNSRVNSLADRVARLEKALLTEFDKQKWFSTTAVEPIEASLARPAFPVPPARSYPLSVGWTSSSSHWMLVAKDILGYLKVFRRLIKQHFPGESIWLIFDLRKTSTKKVIGAREEPHERQGAPIVMVFKPNLRRTATDASQKGLLNDLYSVSIDDSGDFGAGVDDFSIEWL